MTWIKLCGMRSAADVAAAETAGANAVGFVTARKSVRRISASQASEFGAGCTIERFLVTDGETPDALLAAAHTAGVTGVQPHGAYSREAAHAALEAGYSVLFPIAIAAGVDASHAPEGSIPILDGVAPGSGIRFDPSLISVLPERFVLAGGLTPDNVDRVLTELRPYGVDVSSGVEREIGIKEPDLMRRFVEAVR